ncbi:MAG TPA: PIN domain nuclease [Candidatus Dormibacteraeota bacterium]|nr:PIN domain nuclease [Candidatus Dormibacteraeota bacterium]
MTADTLPTLVDTSAWIEFLRGTGSPANIAVRELLAGSEATATTTTESVVMEVLAGARDAAHLDRLRRLMLTCTVVAIEGLADFEEAASLYRTCRGAGETVRSLADCLVAAVAIRADLRVLHADRDYATIARHSALRIAAL